jgi:hypothetical protein
VFRIVGDGVFAAIPLLSGIAEIPVVSWENVGVESRNLGCCFGVCLISSFVCGWQVGSSVRAWIVAKSDYLVQFQARAFVVTFDGYVRSFHTGDGSSKKGKQAPLQVGREFPPWVCCGFSSQM